MAMSCRIVVRPFNGYGPGFSIRPVMNTRRLLISLTMTVGFGSSTNLRAASRMASPSCSGVRPDACTSFKSGSVTLPSGRTVTSDADRSLSRQNRIDSTSSGPMT